MHIAILLWGLTGIFGKAIEMNEVMIVWYRMILSAIALFIIIYFQRKIKFPDFDTIVRVCGVGILVCIHWIFFYASIKASNVSIALSCFSSVTVFTSFLEPIIHRTKFKFRDVLFGIIVMGGIYIIFSFQKWYAKGILFALFSAFLGSLFTVINKQFVSKHSPASITLLELISGFGFLTLLLPVVLPAFNYSFEIPRNGELSFTENNNDWIWLILLSVLCTSIAFTISLEALQKISAYSMNLSVNLEPVYSIILAMIFFDEGKMLNAGFYCGTAIVLLTVVIHTLIEYSSSRKVQKINE